MVGTAIGVGAGLLGASRQAKASKQAANTQAASAAQATQAQLDMYNQSRMDQMPWLQTGGGAVNQLGYLMGVNPQTPGSTGQFGGEGGATPFSPSSALGGFGSLAKPFSMADYQADPGYAFRLSEGMKALERSSAARGGLMSGAALKGIDKYSQGMASQEYGNAYDRYNANQTNLYNRLAGLSGTGQTSANTLSSTGQNTANQIGNNMTSAGAARAAGQMGSSNAWSTGLNAIGQGLAGAYNNYNSSGSAPSYDQNGSPITWGALGQPMVY